MSVSDTFTLGKQPAAGESIQIPLGGDGILAPSSAYLVNVTLLGVAGGGFSRITIDKDPRYSHLVQYLVARTDRVTAADFRFVLIRAGNTGLDQVGTAPVTAVSGVELSTITWTPPPLFGITQMVTYIDNVDTETHVMQALVLNFKIGVEQMTPLPILLANLSRTNSLV